MSVRGRTAALAGLGGRGDFPLRGRLLPALHDGGLRGLGRPRVPGRAALLRGAVQELAYLVLDALLIAWGRRRIHSGLPRALACLAAADSPPNNRFKAQIANAISGTISLRPLGVGQQ